MTLPFRPSARCLFSSSSSFRTPTARQLRSEPLTQPGLGPSWFYDLRDQLLDRKLPRIYSQLDLSKALTLETTLSSFLPSLNKPRVKRGSLLPLGHHLIYFNNILPHHKLLPDGTDTVHSPGRQFDRRMWAGGALKLNSFRAFLPMTGMELRPGKWVCQETIKEVRQHGVSYHDNPKIFVDIERKFAAVDKQNFRLHDDPLTRNIRPEWAMSETVDGQLRVTEAALIEERTLVFMKPRSEEELEAAKRGEAPERKPLDPPGTPDFSHTLTPDQTLLFRFSALTFNAHKIHLDPSYTREVEGYRDLLVHGPLTLTLMLTLLHDHLRTTSPEEALISISYRNIAPLYCNEPMRICGRKRESGPFWVWDVWIEGPNGGMVVRGTCRTQVVPRVEDALFKNEETFFVDKTFFMDKEKALALYKDTTKAIKDMTQALKKRTRAIKERTTALDKRTRFLKKTSGRFNEMTRALENETINSNTSTRDVAQSPDRYMPVLESEPAAVKKRIGYSLQGPLIRTTTGAANTLKKGTKKGSERSPETAKDLSFVP